MCLNMFLFFLGGITVWINDVRNMPGRKEAASQEIYKASITEPLSEKENSFKALAKILPLSVEKKSKSKLLIYFQKDSLASTLGYGSTIIFKKQLQEVRSSGNPGSFDYKQYCLFNGITHQVYLQSKDYKILNEKETNSFSSFIIACRNWTIRTIKKYIPGKKEQGLAEALVIGYKDDLDKNLVQAYSNTGVIHVIAISGLHLGLVYWILLFLTKPLARLKKFSWLRFLLIISGLWIFGITAGAQPSVVRSALMFSCLAFGETISRRTSIYNTLTLSAFVLLCYNPFWIWDAGFQLSYAAVASIIMFYKPVYNLVYFKNKILDFFWQLSAVTCAAQLLTLPVSIYHFHQFPNLFFITNIVAVPLSSLILIGGIILCMISWLDFIALFLGQLLAFMIGFMNGYIERFNNVSIAISEGLYINFPQAFLLTFSILFICFGLMSKKNSELKTGLAALFCFLAIRSHSFKQVNQQQKLIVYNVAKHTAIEFIKGRSSLFVGDSQVLQDPQIMNFNINPSRIVHRVLSSKRISADQFQFGGKKISLVKSHPEAADVLIISRHTKADLDFSAIGAKPMVVIDGSVPFYKAGKYKQLLDSLKVPYHHVTEKGGYVLNLQPLPLWP